MSHAYTPVTTGLTLSTPVAPTVADDTDSMAAALMNSAPQTDADMIAYLQTKLGEMAASVWTARTTPAAYTGICFAPTLGVGTFLAVGNAVTGTSTDGETWTAGSTPAGSYRAVCWNGTIAVAVGDAGVVAITTAGSTTFTAQTAITGSPNLYCIAWNGSYFLALGSNHCVYTSATGATGSWTNQYNFSGLTTVGLIAVAWDGTDFVAVAQTDTGVCKTFHCADPRTTPWTWTAGGTITSTATVAGLIYSSRLGMLVLALSDGLIFTSTNHGTTWTSRTPAFATQTLESIAEGNGVLVATGVAGSTSRCQSSTDGIVWKARRMPANQTYLTAFGHGRFVSVASGASAVASTEPLE